MLKTHKKTREIEGLVNLYKPPNISSFKALDSFKKRIKAKKAGHCGTLDPMADGVLLVCFGKAVRLADILGSLDKKYEGILKLGEATDTQDKEGEVINKGNFENLTNEKIKQTFQEFSGIIKQYPPMYSAVKHKGKPLYTYARNGIEVKRNYREVLIKSISVDKILLPFVHFRVTCSRGTFIRTLCHDIGNKLGCYGHLYQLTRTAIGDFRIQDSVMLDELPDSLDDDYINKLILPMSKALYFLNTLVVDETSKYKILNGQQIQAPLLASDTHNPINNEILKVLDSNQNFLCIASYLNNEKEGYSIIQPKIVIYPNSMVRSLI